MSLRKPCGASVFKNTLSSPVTPHFPKASLPPTCAASLALSWSPLAALRLAQTLISPVFSPSIEQPRPEFVCFFVCDPFSRAITCTFPNQNITTLSKCPPKTMSTSAMRNAAIVSKYGYQAVTQRVIGTYIAFLFIHLFIKPLIFHRRHGRRPHDERPPSATPLPPAEDPRPGRFCHNSCPTKPSDPRHGHRRPHLCRPHEAWPPCSLCWWYASFFPLPRAMALLDAHFKKNFPYR